jgi:hypothetical protein
MNLARIIGIAVGAFVVLWMGFVAFQLYVNFAEPLATHQHQDEVVLHSEFTTVFPDHCSLYIELEAELLLEKKKRIELSAEVSDMLEEITEEVFLPPDWFLC